MAVREAVAKLMSPPFSSQFLVSGGALAQVWEQFLREVYDCLNPLGKEQSFQLQNYVTTTTPLPVDAIAGPVSIDGMQFNGAAVSYAIVEFFIQRFHSGSSAIQGGTFTVSFNAKTNSWSIANGGPHAGITFTITSGGQVQYVSTNIANTKQVSKLTWRARTLAAKVAVPAAGWP